jgi:hypothetical protein
MYNAVCSIAQPDDHKNQCGGTTTSTREAHQIKSIRLEDGKKDDEMVDATMASCERAI